MTAAGASTVVRAGEAVRAGAVAPDTWVRAAFDRIRAGDPYNAFLSLAEAPAEDDVATVGPLAGVPVAVKDNLATVDLPTTCGSHMLEGYVSPFEATAVRRLREAGAVVVGKTNMDEFAMGSSTENSAYGPTLNPVAPGRVPGGSSGGSAAAVAAGMVPAALGSDTGGSVRQPAALCGIVGFKPTYGRVSRYGLVAFASSLDQVGTLTRSVADATSLLEVVSGHDPRDSTSAELPPPELAASLSKGVDGLRVGVPAEYLPPSLAPGVRALCDGALDCLRQAGAEVVDVSLPHTHLAIPTYYVIATAEASGNLARYDGVRYGHRAANAGSAAEMVERSRSEGFGAEVKRRIALGTYALSAGYYDAYYGRAQRARGLLSRDFERAFTDVDVLFTPTSPTPAFPFGARLRDPVQMYLSDVFTVTANLVGLPALSLPIGSLDGLPVGGQLLAPRWREDRIVAAAAALETALGGGPE